MSIVCATHFTDSSNDAVHVAAALAGKTRQAVLLASVLPALQLSDALGHRKELDVTDNLETAAQLLRSEGIKAEAELVHGAVDSALARLCARQRAQLLVVGDSSRGGRPLFGKPIDRLPYELSIPLLVVRSARPFEDWAQGKGPLRVLLAIDHTWRSELARNWIERLAEYGPLEVIATHVWSPDEEAARHGFVSAVLPDREAMRSRALATAQRIAALSPVAVAGTKAQLNYSRGRPVADGLAFAAAWNGGALQTGDVAVSAARLMGGGAAAADDFPPLG